MKSQLEIRRDLRNTLRRQRRALSAAEQTLAAQKLVLRLGNHPWVKKARHLAFYWPNDGEISPLPLMKALHSRGKFLYLPALHSRNQLLFRLYKPSDRLHRNRFGIPEPAPSRTTRTANQLDVLFMPLVGFDSHGNRLGMGGGFYDRTLADCKKKGPRLIGLAHQLQQVPGLGSASWDVPMHAIATDKRLFVVAT